MLAGQHQANEILIHSAEHMAAVAPILLLSMPRRDDDRPAEQMCPQRQFESAGIVGQHGRLEQQAAIYGLIKGWWLAAR
ncbi:MAG TPA: hypothetical protein VGU72_14920 [Beijerinckiaceae bacterium]|nr:hypothetical protein [Beijerinckiaceae bacterium]